MQRALKAHWGFSELRPEQSEAVNATLEGRDALVVLPTGGGKSICYQLPPLLQPAGVPSLGLVISPLLALMKDQVDTLRLAGYPAAALGVSHQELGELGAELREGRLKLLLLSPERLFTSAFRRWLEAHAGWIGSLAIDEAHCISHWGHDFRPEYRRLGELRGLVPGRPILACTATATPRVQEDIIAQLGLRSPARVVGRFDRPNLTYRAFPRLGDGVAQISAALDRHPGEGAIIYCASRRQTESIAQALQRRGRQAEAYHAGLEPPRRAAVQEAFLGEGLDIIAATVAFGMGIDRPDVRLVLHASLPSSVEAFQQETGRAGRDGEPAECVLLHSLSDLVLRRRMIDAPADEGRQGLSPEQRHVAHAQLQEMATFAHSSRCRHRALSEHFGQTLPEGSCAACDLCLQELMELPDCTTVARKILSGVARLAGPRGDAYGAGYLADMLLGSRRAALLQRGHEQLSTWGLLKEHRKVELLSYIGQLVDQGALHQSEGELPTLHLSAQGRQIMKGELPCRLLRQVSDDQLSAHLRERRQGAQPEERELSPDEQRLFQRIRALRRELAAALGVPPFRVFPDTVLREICRVRPSTEEALLATRGVGRRTVESVGDALLLAIATESWALGLALDQDEERTARRESPSRRVGPPRREQSEALLRGGSSISEVAGALALSETTVVGHLAELLRREPDLDPSPWIAPELIARVLTAAKGLEPGRLKPVYEALGGQVSYDQLRLALACHPSPPLPGTSA